MPSGNELPSRTHKQRVDLDTLISKINDFLSVPIPGTPKGCEELYFDEGRNLLRDLQQQYLRITIKIDLDKDKISPEFMPTGEMIYFQRMELPELHSRLQTRLRELIDKAETRIPLEDIPLTKTFLESPKKPFHKDLKKPLAELRKFLGNDRVIRILRRFKRIEDSVFVVFILLPLIHFETYEGESGKMEKTFIMAKPLANTRPSKRGPKDPEGANEIIIMLSIHFKERLRGEYYDWIADLLRLAQGKKWTGASVKMRLQRLKKSKGWNQEWEERRYNLWRGMSKDAGEDGGLNEAPRSKLRGILSAIAPKPYPPSLLRATARSPRHSSLQQAAEYPGEGE